MTDKDPNDMTASEQLRLADSHPCSMCHLVMDGDESCATTGCASWAYRLADKIDAEIVKAYSEKLNTCAMRWAKANGWPDFREGEDFGAWLDRCTYKKPVDDCNEPVQFGDEIELHYRSGGVEKGRLQEVFINSGPVMILSFVGANTAREYRYDTECDILKRPAPEVLGADGKPIKVGDAMWSLSGAGPLTVTSLHTDDPTPDGGYSPWADLDDDGLYSWIYAGSLTHTPPDTLERLRDDIAEWRADCAIPGSGWDAKTAEWAARIDAIIRRRGGAE